MLEIVAFTVVTIGLLYLSRYALRNIGSHGFYRFFAFEGILLILLMNHAYWFVEPFSFQQIFSWIFLLISIYFIANSLHFLKEQGGYKNREMMPENFTFENTTNLVEEGLYRYIRHPMYSSLLFLAWGAFLKNISLLTSLLVLFITLFLYWTARVEERENINFFGDEYKEYMQRTKIFVPWIV